MLLIKLIMVSICCHLSCGSAAIADEKMQIRQTNDESNKKDTQPQLTPSTPSNIYRIKRLNLSKDKLQQQQQQQSHNTLPALQQESHYQQATDAQEPSNIHHPDSKATMKRVVKGNVGSSDKGKAKKVKSLTKSTHILNRKLLSKLGFTKVKAPNSHNRKRLAIESRRHASPDDSHMFIIKLPPNMYYYANPKPPSSAGNGSPNALTSSPAGLAAMSASLKSPSSSSSSSASSSSSTSPTSSSANVKSSLNLQSQLLQDDMTKDANGKKVSFPFNSNGKPGRIYHWNLPVIKKMLEEKQQRFPSLAHLEPNKVQQLIDIKNIPTWSKPWENESIEKSYNPHHHHHHSHDPHQDAMMSYKKSLKRKSPSYYAPANTVNKNSFNKYFPGNGKPKGFYVIKENQKKPLYYKNIVA